MSSSGKIKFAIIGAGVIAPLHAGAIRAHPEAELVAVADSVKEKAQKLANEYGVPFVYEHIGQLLEQCEVDAVCVCLPSGLHGEAVIAAAEAGKHVLCEKPLDITLKSMDAMIAACRNHKVKLATVFQKRTTELAIRTRQAVQQGKLGKLVLGDAYLKYYRSPEYYRSADWRGTWEIDGGGALMNQGVHGVDIIRWIMGDVDSVFAYAAPLVRDIEVEDTAVAVVKYRNGAFGVIQGATSVNPGQEPRFEIHGEHGSIVYADSGIKLWKTADGEEPPVIAAAERRAEGSDNPHDISEDGHYMLLDDLIRAIREDREPLISGEEARKSVELILAIYESARTGKEVKLL
ncbi:Glucose--fructose oxidoreductase precursor [Paenibacillus konkukensis]|uniref:Glucose--fructose oxidoreductase n=1 Tax=Paenibacillus konkukensis TaxID=2020716 RepID=A0ABY4RW35_9BACL|nr:Gfo/Idh/MocA family oxidoreductase [Paenibacillus konkukensis]UQZ86327.1 Glucose--fructose oxidoreductase precursor [Paenibacillus konkukensis]